MDAHPAIPKDIGRIAGPLLIGYLLDWGLFGLLSVQVYIYYLAFVRDGWRHQMIVYALYTFQMAQTFLLTQSSFVTFATGFGNLNQVNNIHHIWFSVPIMTSSVAFVVQGFFAYRIYQMSGKKWIPALIVLLSATQVAGGVVTGIFGHDAVVFSRFLDRKAYIATGIWNGAGALGDIIIAVSMLHYLTNANSKGKLHPSRSPIFLRLLIQSGALLAIIATINTVLSLLPGRPSPTYFQTTSGILGNTYANTLMALLNARMTLMRAHTDLEGGSSEYRLTAPEQTIRSALVFASRDGEITMVGEDPDLEALEMEEIRRRNGSSSMEKE